MSPDPQKEQSNVSSIGEQKILETEKTSILVKPTRRDFMIRVLYLYAAVIIISALGFTAWSNPEIFKLKPETLSVITEFYNALTLLLVPFILGIIGAFARVLISGIKASQHLPIIFSSGLMASFSWLSLKSKIFLALVTPYIPHAQPEQVAAIAKSPDIGNEFYSMALVAVLVGMFASNIYIAISEKVERLTNEKKRV
jgi:hypothetical protein